MAHRAFHLHVLPAIKGYLPTAFLPDIHTVEHQVLRTGLLLERSDLVKADNTAIETQKKMVELEAYNALPTADKNTRAALGRIKRKAKP